MAASAENTYLDLDYSGYHEDHENLIDERKKQLLSVSHVQGSVLGPLNNCSGEDLHELESLINEELAHSAK